MIQKEKMYEYFLRAFELAEIPCDPIAINNRPYLKPGRAWYKQLGEQVINNYEEDAACLPVNYPQYLKNYFEKLLRALGQEHTDEIGFYEIEMKPLFAFSEGVKVKKQSFEFADPVLISRKPFRIWNLWRAPMSGKLSMTQDYLVHQGMGNRSVIPRGGEVEEVQMKPFQGSWLKLKTQEETYYLAISDGCGNLKQPEPLKKLLIPDLKEEK